ncbi:MAG: rod shape-determining protein MreD [Desulfobulbaceae bacterium]|nr:rod shape-determining protein MreD [Desulfobulbaceae bacterium]HIJ77686.1 rod shape-determining protein MreD [Deltaproteobacteria bacterium]
MVFSLLLLLGIFLLTLQTTILHLLPDWIGRPDLLFLLIVYLGTHLDIFKGAALALLFGLLMDIFSGIFLGLHPVAYLILFFILKTIDRHLAITEPIHQVPVVALSYLFTASSIFIFASMLIDQAELNWSWGKIILQLLILSTICLPFFNLFTWITTAFDPKNRQNPFRRARTGNRFRA